MNPQAVLLLPTYLASIHLLLATPDILPYILKPEVLGV